MCLQLLAAVPALFAGGGAAGTGAAAGIAASNAAGAVLVGGGTAAAAGTGVAAGAAAGLTATQWALLGASALSGVASGVGAYQQGQAAADAAKANAAIALRKANDETEQGQYERDQLRLRAAQDRASGLLSFAGGNVQLGTGSVADWESDVNQTLELDLAQSRENADRRRLGLTDERANFLREKSAARTGGRLGLVSGVISGAAQGGSNYYSFKNPRV